MSEENNINKNSILINDNKVPGDISVGKKIPKNQLFFLKISLLFTLIFLSILIFVYWQDLTKRRSLSRIDNEKFNNLDSDIFDLSNDFIGNNSDENIDSSDVDIKELNGKSAGFIYQLLIKNQIQIEDLKKQNRELKNEFIKYKSYEKFNKIVIGYVAFRDKLLNQENYKIELQNLELICSFDDNLLFKINNLKSYLNHFYAKQQLKNDFKKIIPEIKAKSNLNTFESPWLKSFNEKISKIIIIRRTLINNSGDIDDKIIAIEKNLEAENYQEALSIILSFDQIYNQVFKNFLENLNSSLEIQKIDQEILNYLKSLN